MFMGRQPPSRSSARSTPIPALPTATASTRSVPTCSNKPATATAPKPRTNAPLAPPPTDPSRSTYECVPPNCPQRNSLVELLCGTVSGGGRHCIHSGPATLTPRRNVQRGGDGQDDRGGHHRP